VLLGDEGAEFLRRNFASAPELRNRSTISSDFARCVDFGAQPVDDRRRRAGSANTPVHDDP
jgi:hypothetical protein